MNKSYAAYLKRRFDSAGHECEKRVKAVEGLEHYLKKEKNVDCIENASADDIIGYTKHLTNVCETETAIWQIAFLGEYAEATGNEELALNLVFITDGSDVMELLSQQTKEHTGDDTWGKIFGGVTLPDARATLDEKSDFTRMIENRFLDEAGIEQYRKSCECVAHGCNPWYTDERTRFLECGSVDGYCQLLNDEELQELIRCYEDKTLFFATSISKEVLEYAKSYQTHIRNGEYIYVTKIPFSADKYLHEKDARMKRYYFCHCQWAKQSILQDAPPLSDGFCSCSLGYHKALFESAFGCKLEGEIVESVLRTHDLRCVFKIKIPIDIMNQYT